MGVQRRRPIPAQPGPVRFWALTPCKPAPMLRALARTTPRRHFECRSCDGSFLFDLCTVAHEAVPLLARWRV